MILILKKNVCYRLNCLGYRGLNDDLKIIEIFNVRTFDSFKKNTVSV